MTSQNSQPATAADFYNDRYARVGNGLEAVGWGSRESQKLRFEVLFRGLDPRRRSVLDVGCGLGDLVHFMKDRVGNEFLYIGIDVAEEFIEDASRSFAHEPSRFYHGDLFNLALPQVDYAIASGTFSLRSDDGVNYAKASMKRMYELSTAAVAVNFLSNRVDFEASKNLHFAPEEVLSWALDITPNVVLHSDYPLYEFTVQLFR